MNAERAVILQILSNEPEQSCTRPALQRELSDIPPKALDEALLGLERTGVIERSKETVSASHGARRLDELGLIGV